MNYDLAIIGGGPGGYTAALRGAQLGMKVVLIEKKRVGGVCLNEGCIPTKALLSSAHLAEQIKSGEKLGINVKDYDISWEGVKAFMRETVDKLVTGVEYLLEKSGVTVIHGEAHLSENGSIKVNEEIIEAKWKIIATGSRPVELPFLPFGERVLTSSKLIFADVFPETLAVIGAGAIGLEMATAFSILGSKVTIIEALATPLGGNMDRDMFAFLNRALRERGIQLLLSTKVEDARVNKTGVNLRLSTGKELEVDYVLVAVGRRPNSDKFPFLERDKHGFIKTDNELKTSMNDIYAIGDVAGQPLLAHKASHEAIFAVETIAGKDSHKPGFIPYAVFTIPEFAGVGMNEEEAKKQGIKIKKAKFPMKANGRALSLGEENGVVKVISDENDKILGVQALGPSASEIIAEATAVMEKGGRAEDIAGTVHIHPTVSETIMEASMALLGKAIHILNR